MRIQPWRLQRVRYRIRLNASVFGEQACRGTLSPVIPAKAGVHARRVAGRWARAGPNPGGNVRLWADIIGIVAASMTRDPAQIDLAMMRRALLAAERAAEKGEVPVGAVVARGGEVLAIAANEREATGDPTAHAELLAIRRASATTGTWRLTGCTLYATLEPCPMCAGAAHASRLSRLVYAASDPKAGYAGTLHDTPADTRLNHTLRVEGGLLAERAAALLRDFFHHRRRGPRKAPETPLS